MTAPTQEVVPGQGYVGEAEATYLLRTSRARLAELVLERRLTPVGDSPPRVFSRNEVDALAAAWAPPGGWHTSRIRPPEGRLPRVEDKTVWLLHDWGGSGRGVDIQIALTQTAHAASKVCNRLREGGYVQWRGRRWCLTAKGWSYTRQHDPPV